jgi:hypothetical protein
MSDAAAIAARLAFVEHRISKMPVIQPTAYRELL